MGYVNYGSTHCADFAMVPLGRGRAAVNKFALRAFQLYSPRVRLKCPVCGDTCTANINELHLYRCSGPYPRGPNHSATEMIIEES